MKFWLLPVRITQVTDQSCFPNIVCGELTDAHGRVHTFEEKAPVIVDGDIRVGEPFPQPGVVAGEIISAWHDEIGRELVRLCTVQPLGIASSEGETEFEVMRSDLREL